MSKNASQRIKELLNVGIPSPEIFLILRRPYKQNDIYLFDEYYLNENGEIHELLVYGSNRSQEDSMMLLAKEDVTSPDFQSNMKAFVKKEIKAKIGFEVIFIRRAFQ